MIKQLTGQKIAILGFGKEGQATFDFLMKKGVKVAAVLDLSKELKPDQMAKLQKADVALIGGENYLDSLGDFDMIFRSPGVPRLHPKLVAYPDQDRIYSNIKLFFDLCPCPVVAVTGTKGKTTTTSLIHEIISAAGKKVFLGGNIGEPPLNFIDETSPDSIVVLEVSSFQSQDLHMSPHVGVILNVTHDHLDDGTFRAASHVTNDEYLLAKAQLIANQTSEDVAILHPALDQGFTKSGQGKKVIYNPQDFVGWERKLLGDHNLENIAAAVLACRELGIEESIITAAVAKFSGVPQRLQLVAEKNGIKYLNDSASTNPDATIAAVKSFVSGIVLIVGGSDKGLDYTEFGQAILSSPQVKGLIIIGQITNQIEASVKGFDGQILTGAKNMTEIIAQANSIAKPGDVVLLSPAAASFGMFENSKDRGNQFDACVNLL